MAGDKTNHLHGDRPSAVTDRADPDRKELAATALQRTRMPMVVTDARQKDQPIVLANQAFLQLTGYSAEELLGRNCRLLQGPDTVPEAVAEIRSALLKDREVSVELLNYRKDGSTFWNQLHLSPIHDDEGRLIYHFGSQIDRTDYQRMQTLEASEHRLLLEVDHRANNVLALVESIVRLTRTDNADLYAASVQRRIQALSKAHMLLARHGWHQIPLRETLVGQIEPYGAGRTTLDGPSLLLESHAVQPLALFVHELATNAALHGSLSRPSGHVEVSWRNLSQGNGLVLVWSETGGPSMLPERRTGFGTVLADATVRR